MPCSFVDAISLFFSQLPVILTKYLSPVTLDGPQFFAQWQQLEAPGLEHQQVLKGSGTTVQTAFMGDVLRKYGFAVLPSVDPNPNNVSAAASFVNATGVVVPVLVRLEGNAAAAMARLTVRASNNSVATTVAKFVAVLIEVAPQ